MAAATVKAWNNAASDDDHDVIPGVLEDVTGHLSAIWPHGQLCLPSVTSCAPMRRHSGGEVGALTGNIEAIEAECDTASDRVNDLENKLPTA